MTHERANSLSRGMGPFRANIVLVAELMRKPNQEFFLFPSKGSPFSKKEQPRKISLSNRIGPLL